MIPRVVDGAQKLIERFGEAAKLPFPIHAHMLRHAAGYALACRAALIPRAAAAHAALVAQWSLMQSRNGPVNPR